MVDTGTGFTGVKRSHGLWANKLLLGGSAFDQTGGAVTEIAVSGTQVTGWFGGGLSGLNITATGSLTARTILNDAGSPWKQGITYQFTARENISGGMLVSLSGAGLAMSTRIAAAPPIGVALAGAGSNTTVNVMVHGIHNFIAEETIEAGNPVKVGTGAAINTVLLAGSPGYGTIGQAITRAGSPSAILVYIGKGASN